MSWQRDIESAWAVGDLLPLHNDMCAVCGSANPSAPLTEPFAVLAGDAVGARVRFTAQHQGAPHYAHGGWVASVLDDACGYLSYITTRMFVTAHFEIDYRRPVLLGATYDVRAVCTGIEGRKVHTRAELVDADCVVAESTGLFITVDIEHFRP